MILLPLSLSLLLILHVFSSLSFSLLIFSTRSLVPSIWVASKSFPLLLLQVIHLPAHYELLTAAAVTRGHKHDKSEHSLCAVMTIMMIMMMRICRCCVPAAAGIGRSGRRSGQRPGIGAADRPVDSSICGADEEREQREFSQLSHRHRHRQRHKAGHDRAAERRK